VPLERQLKFKTKEVIYEFKKSITHDAEDFFPNTGKLPTNSGELYPKPRELYPKPRDFSPNTRGL